MRFVIEVEVVHVSGKFASRDEVEEKLVEALEEAVDLYGLGPDGDSEYSVEDVSVAPPAPRRRRVK